MARKFYIEVNEFCIYIFEGDVTRLLSIQQSRKSVEVYLDQYVQKTKERGTQYQVIERES